MNNKTKDNYSRPDPDRLLLQINSEEKKKMRGNLKIFLGMAAGVGKTYAMLRAAKDLQKSGTDVVLGIVETHGRKETIELLQGLEVVPRKMISYNGVDFEELDLEAILNRQPKLVLVDELAHTNIPGGKHSKRYLDILELINAGIDVFTTVNIQHLESRSGTVKEITGITVHETVADSFFDLADEIVVVDVAPEELLKRLKEGKIYPEERISTAEGNFFKKGNLTALREMALRHAAERVDRELRDYKQLHGIEETWKSSNRLLVAIFASPYSETLIRWTRRLADLMNATWIGAYIEQDYKLSKEEISLLSKNMNLVRELGGEVITTKDDDIVNGIIRLARQNNATQIVVGKSQRGFFRNLISGGSIVNRLLRKTGDIDVYSVVPSSKNGDSSWNPKRPFKTAPDFIFEELGWVVALTMTAWFVAGFSLPIIGYQAVGIIFLITVCFSGLVLSRSSNFILAAIFTLIHNFFFIPPLYTFAISKPEDVMIVTMFFIAAAVIGHLTTRLKSKERILEERERRALIQYELSRLLAKAQSIEEVSAVMLSQTQKIFHQEVSLFILDQKTHQLKIFKASSFGFNEKEKAVAEWVWQNNKSAGRFTETLSGSEGFYLPISGKNFTLGVLGIKVKTEGELDAEQISLIETFSNQFAAALEREFFHEQSRSIKVMEETQKLYKTLLDSVSHELKTPLAAIKGSASALLDPQINKDISIVKTLSAEILTGSSRLQELVENLLDMTRIESGMLRPKVSTCSVTEILDSCLRKENFDSGSRKLLLKIDQDLPDAYCDPILVEQVLSNIIRNAQQYSPENSLIEIKAYKQAAFIAISISDQGVGLPVDNPQSVFEKFFRVHPEKTGGVGLGLCIAKNLIELQHGQIKAENHPTGGALFTILLPTEGTNESSSG